MARRQKLNPAELLPQLPGRPKNILPEEFRGSPAKFLRERIEAQLTAGTLLAEDASLQREILDEMEGRWTQVELPAIASFVNLMYGRQTFTSPQDFMIVSGLWDSRERAFKLSHGDPAIARVFAAHGFARPITDAFAPVHDPPVPMYLAVLAFERVDFGDESTEGLETSRLILYAMPADLEEAVRDGHFTADVIIGGKTVYTENREAVHGREWTNVKFRRNDRSRHPRKYWVAFRKGSKKPIFAEFIPERFLEKGEEGKEGYQPATPVPVQMCEFADGYQAKVLPEGEIAPEHPEERTVADLLAIIAHQRGGPATAKEPGEFLYDGRVWNAMKVLGIETADEAAIRQVERRYSRRAFDQGKPIGSHAQQVLGVMGPTDRTRYMMEHHVAIFNQAVEVARAMVVKPAEGDKPKEGGADKSADPPPPATAETERMRAPPADPDDKD